MNELRDLLFPQPARRFPGQRAIKISLRAVHVLFVCGFVGAVFAGHSPTQLWYIGTAISGLILLLFDLYASAVFIVQTRGLMVAIKITLFLLLPQFGSAQAIVLGGLVLLSVVSSHAPSGWRYFMLVGRDRLPTSTDKG